MDPFELSISPYFNDVISAAQIVDCDPQQEDNMRDFAETLEFMAKFAHMLASQFEEALKTRPKTELTIAAPRRFEQALQKLTAALTQLNGYRTNRSHQELVDGLEAGRQALKEMFAIFEDMRQEEEAFPQFSESPYIQELVRVATGVAKKQYPPETLRDKLAWMRARHQEFRKDFADLKTSPKESDELDTLIPAAEVALNEMGTALDTMAIFFKDYDRKHLKEGCAALLQTSERLMKIQKRLMTISVAQPAACPKCGVMNPGGVKTCQECGATLPEIIGLSKQTIELREQQASRPSYTYLARLEGAVEGKLQNYLSDEELRKQIDAFALRADQGRRDFEKIEMPKDFPDEVTRQIAERSHKLLDDGTMKIVAGTQILRKYFESGDREDLVNGLETIYSGADDIGDSQELTQSLASASAKDKGTASNS